MTGKVLQALFFFFGENTNRIEATNSNINNNNKKSALAHFSFTDDAGRLPFALD